MTAKESIKNLFKSFSQELKELSEAARLENPFYAYNAQQLSINACEKEIKLILEKIKDASKEGNTHLFLDNSLREGTILKLMKLGFTVYKDEIKWISC